VTAPRFDTARWAELGTRAVFFEKVEAQASSDDSYPAYLDSLLDGPWRQMVSLITREVS
jgi:hypothetical protein